ncbi:universal stress protein [Pseudenhygromyxa sp. WMMC2535]|uniref:universal stress protein n=1 Tax=Pseudenhygromyxa sp. WMMC2535 TaxID=2712867 RepID=UPI00155826B2|nr:universal stress protein [Pseudenhygromyxa sp. WMMC2535]NVB37768.1 universal stress protein [Pseudenhygromyxa sp. WMMC2535]
MSEHHEIQKDLMRWVVALDLRPHSHGAINFARWLHEQDKGGELGHELSIEGLHMVDASLLDLPEAGARAQVLGNARKAADAGLAARGAREAFAHVDAVETQDVVESLATAGALAGTVGLIIGRRAKGDDLALVRLGRVARKLLRRLDSPVFVVPPDLELRHLGAGPIVCAVTLDEPSATAARFAIRLGRAIGRSVRLVHAFDAGSPTGLPYLPEGAWDDIHHKRREIGVRDLEAWRAQNDLDAKIVTVDGSAVTQLITAARELDGCMIICGSRHLGTVERLWVSSIGSALAATSHLPVGVIPTPAQAAAD